MIRSTNLLSLAAMVAIANSLTAQITNDECTGAISVVQGINGPFSTVGATTSLPPWTCASGGSDIWFVYVAPGSGPLTVDTCTPARDYDTALRLFDGNGGCGNLTLIACNDDFCSLGSSITTNVNTGDVVYICLGGFAGRSGNAEIQVNGPLGTGQVVATAQAYGPGCVARPGSVYEPFPDYSAWDLDGLALTMVSTGNEYLALPFGSFVPPQNAVALTLGDDTETPTPTLSLPFPYPGGVASSLIVCSNGYVSVASGNGTGFAPSITTFLGAPHTGFYCWHDFNPTIAGSGQVLFEEIGTVAYITWDNVYSFGRSSGGSTFQMQFDCASGSVTIAWVAMDPQGSSTNTGNQYLVGFRLGGQTLDGGPTDLSMAIPTSFQVAPDIRALALSNTGRPVVGTTMQLNTSNIPTTAPFGAILLSVLQTNQDLTLLGMPGCWKHNNGDVTLLFLPGGASSFGLPFAVPNVGGALLGLSVFAQSVVYAPAANLTPLGAISSNGLDLILGNL